MNGITRRKMIATGAAAVAGAAGLAVADRLARQYGLVPPDNGGFFGPGETLTYAVQRVLTLHGPVRQFPRSMISQNPFANETSAPKKDFLQMQANGFKDWRLTVDGMVARPTTFSVADLKSLTAQSQITEVACEEGWSYIAEWIGTPLHEVLKETGVSPGVRYIVYESIQNWMWESIDMSDALHPQTLLTWGMNDGDLPVGFGGPLRLRVPRQLGYKSVKFLTRITAVESLKHVRNGMGSVDPQGGYSWYAGI